jgi:hypothetical protein
MLLDFEHGGKPVTAVYYQSEFRRWKRNMTAAEIAAVRDEIHRMLDSGPIHTTSWMPGSDWSGTPFDPIYWKGTRQDNVAAAKCFGFFVMECILEREEPWGFGHYEKDGIPIKGRTYFRLGL